MPAIPAIMAIGKVVAVVGTAVSAASAYQQGRYQKAAGKYQAKIAQEDANEALRAGAEEEASFRKKARAQWGSNISNIGTSGISMGGSPLLVMSEVAEETEMEALNVRRGSGLQAGRLMSQSSIYESSGKQAYNQGLMRAGGTLMQGAGEFVSASSKPKAYRGASSAGYAGMGGASQFVSVR
jgi:hypothetical protein